MATQGIAPCSHSMTHSAPAHQAQLQGCSRQAHCALQPPAAQARPLHSGPPAGPSAQTPAPPALLPCTRTYSAPQLPAARLLPRPPRAQPQYPALRCCLLARSQAQPKTCARALAHRVRRQLGLPGPPAGLPCHPTGAQAAQPAALMPGQACVAAAPPRQVSLAR